MYNFIVNPEAGSGKSLKIWKVIARYMESHSTEYEVFLTEGIGDARAATTRLTNSHDEPRYITVVGGNGTMGEALNGVFSHGPLSLGYIPAGPDNDLARSLRMPGCTIKCLRKQLAPRHFTMIDYGVLTYGNQEVSHRWFLVSTGAGFDTTIYQDVLSSRCRQRLNHLGMGKLSYILIGIHQFFKYKPYKGYILLDGVKKVEFSDILFISCHIQPSEGGGFLFALGADGSDRKLSICVISHGTRTRLIPILLPAPIGGRRLKGVKAYECREVSIHTETALPVHADGESCSFQTDIQVSCIAKKTRIMI